jgi:putative DNA primase/helicase
MSVDEIFGLAAQTTRYYNHLYGTGRFKNGRAVVLKSTAFNEPIYCQSGADASRAVSEISGDVYAMVSITNCRDPHGRGTVADVVALPGLWAEIDVDPSGVKRTANGKETKVPSSSEEAIRILSTLPIPPTMLVGSGGLLRGVHAYWAFSEPWYFETLSEAEALEHGWYRTVAKVFADHGYRLDSVFDLVRVLRPAGTVNSKYGEPVEILAEHEVRYNPSDFAEYAEAPRRSGLSAGAQDFEYRDIEITGDIRKKLDDTTRLGKLWREEASVSPKDKSQSGWDFELAKSLFQAGIVDQDMHRAILMEYRETHCDDPRKMAKGANPAYAKSTYTKARQWHSDTFANRGTPDEDFAAISNGPWDDPRRIIEMLEPKLSTLKYYFQKYYIWDGTSYRSISKDDVFSEAWSACEEAAYRENVRAQEIADASEKPARLVKVSKSMSDNVMAGLMAAKKVTDTGSLPVWANGRGPCPVERILPVQNGILDVHTRTLYSPTPNYLGIGTSSTIYNPDAQCPMWLDWLDKVFSGDEESIRLVQEWTAYLLTGRTDLEKMMLLIGASRGGKGTLSRVWKKLVGPTRTVTPRLSELGQQFGLETMMYSSLALIGDVRVNAHKGTAEIMETLLGWVGRDGQNIQRKNRETIPDAFPSARFVIAANELPNLREESTAFLARVVLLRFTKSHRGKEDITLEGRLHSELPGILNWGLDGIAKLNSNPLGHFTMPKRSEPLLRAVDESTGTIRCFVEDCLEETPGKFAVKDEVYKVYLAWCAENQSHAVGKAHFGRKLFAAIDELDDCRKTIPGYPGQVWCYRRLSIKKTADDINARGDFDTIE